MDLEVLKKIVYDTHINDKCVFTEKEQRVLELYLKEKNETEEIGKHLGLPNDLVLLNLNNSFEKITVAIKKLLQQDKHYQRIVSLKGQLLNEINLIRESPSIQSSMQLLLPIVTAGEIDLNSLEFSARAKAVIQELNISTLEQLSNISKDHLEELRNCGRVTIKEIAARLEEHGYTLK